MKEEDFYFPFGEKLKKVEQKDKTPKEVFVLGVYASAVHAKWIDAKGKQKVSALAVASEPEIFWRGENAKSIISTIKIPNELGKLVVPNKSFNGPSGQILDDLFLSPLGIKRDSAWLCDIVPFSRINKNQKNALNTHYTNDIIQKYNLKSVSISDFDQSELDSEERRKEIVDELKLSKAKKIILLGDLPIKYFLNYFDKKYNKLSQFGVASEDYGKEHNIEIEGEIYKVIPLCHPRQAGRLGTSTSKWGKLHDYWVKKQPNNSRNNRVYPK